MSWYWYLIIAEFVGLIVLYIFYSIEKSKNKEAREKEKNTLMKIKRVKNEKDPTTIDDLISEFNKL